MKSEKSKKIIFLINSLEGGGAERIVLTLCEGFVGRGNEVHLILLYNRISFPIAREINLLILNKNRNHNLITKAFDFLALSFKLKSYLRTINFDPQQDIFTSHLPFSNFVSWTAGIKNHCAVIHGALSFKYKSSLTRFFLKLIFKNKRMIGVSQGVKNDLINYFSLAVFNVGYIYNPFQIEKIQKLSEESIDPPLGNYVIHVSRFIKLKRHDLLLKAFKKSELYKSHKLLLLGEGPEKEYVQSFAVELGIDNYVIFKNWLENPYPWIKNAKLLVLCSDHEGLPTVLVESLICHTPVVSTDCRYGPDEILVGDLEKFLVPVNSPDQLANAMIKAVADYPIISSKYYDKFHVNHVLDQYLMLNK
ncbi:glycosyltransferase [Algoriphagus hitonicola]|uniref:Glycosyltransferase involved in cell wall bisynthesis n=1 Tax=Algoriphagus hitonicola TaxID=435880 RepID=A0A1I2X4G9_9BACT|nr:glycosyltransferase [Algoriphagus hitonicola]SFH08425.1 Glycosyltransferase involved in cell wall bisynthesis [Algoriphagus hitonicola]